MDRKEKLLKRYMGEVKTRKQNYSTNSLLVRDDEVEFNESISSDSESEDQGRRKRIHSSDQEDGGERPVIEEEEGKKSRRVSKGMRKALGLKKGEEADQFLKAVKIQGIEMGELQDYLKKNKEGLKIESSKREKKKKKQKDKDSLAEQAHQVKLEEQPAARQQQSSDSDMVIPEQARTIYRNKDGSIRQHSKAKEKQIRQAQMQSRLAEWEKGMKRDESQSEPEEGGRMNIWDDPIRRWQGSISKPMTCKYQGYANRFNIKPGMRWDGVIRGNGFENRYLQEINLQKEKEGRENREYLKNL